MDALASIYSVGFLITLVFGFIALMEDTDGGATILLLSPVWPILYSKFIWRFLKS